jgi:hypothetical protein
MTVTKVSQAGLSLTEAFSGVLQTNANFVDQVIFGPAVDGRAWNGLWNKASVFSSLMLATIEDEGSNTEINIWDLTQQAAGSPSTTVLATVDLSAAATPTAIAASMGYLIVSSEDGIAIIDPHSGAWAERTVGWPRTLSTSTTPALTNNDVEDVAAGLSNQPAYDPRTGGPMPTFGIAYGTGADIGSLLKDDGNVYDRSGTVTDGQGAVVITNSKIGLRHNSGGGRLDLSDTVIANITADDWGFGDIGGSTTGEVPGLGFDDTASGQGNLIVGGSDAGLTMISGIEQKLGNRANQGGSSVKITRAYNSGHMTTFSKGAWLANSKTVDRSVQANTLTENGTVTEGAVESGAELNGYSSWSSSNNLTVASNADWDVITTGMVHTSIWFKSSGNSATEYLFSISNSAGTLKFVISLLSDGTMQFRDDGATALVDMTSTATYDNGVWHKADFVRVSSTDRYMYIDGVLITSSTTDAGSLSSSGNIPIGIGVDADGSSAPATSSTLALACLSALNSSSLGAPTAAQIRQMYDDEKGMFVASAECLLQSGSTDAVIDVNVDPLTGKVLVTQTDAITVFDGLVVDSKPTVNSGSSEKGKLWGDLRAEQNSANAYVTAPAVDQRQVNEMVRGLASDLPAGVDLSKAKGWCQFNGGTNAINGSFNVKSLTDLGTGNYVVNWAIPFKASNSGTSLAGGGVQFAWGAQQTTTMGGTADRTKMNVQSRNSSGTLTDDNYLHAIQFGELENE